jgi:hypothetical protein
MKNALFVDGKIKNINTGVNIGMCFKDYVGLLSGRKQGL